MTLLDVIRVNSGECVRRIELHQGDLTQLSPQDTVDLLILSAFRAECIPTSGSLIGALASKGLSVYQLSQNKAVDLRQVFSCWLSHPIQTDNPELRFNRILCFEPSEHRYVPDAVGDIFQALAPFIGGEPSIRTAAMPVVATGCQGYSIRTILSSLIEHAVHWMKIGMPLETLKIVTYSDWEARQSAKLFSRLKLTIAKPTVTDFRK